MVQFTFDGLFRTTNKGLPDTSNIDPYSYVSVSFFANSLVIEIILALVILSYTAMAVYRAFYKIRNQKFFPQITNVQAEQQNNQDQTIKSKSQVSGQGDQKSNADLIYRFDGDQNQKQKNSDDKQKDQQQEQNDDNQQGASQETTQWFLDIDHKMLFVQPFFIGFIIVNNVFVANPFVVIALIVSLVLFFTFNIKKVCQKTKILQNLFMVPSIVVMVLVYFDDFDMRT